MFLGHDAFGLSQGLAVRLSLLSAALWWAGFTLIPVLRLRNYPPQQRRAGAGRPDAAQLRAALDDAARRCGATR